MRLKGISPIEQNAEKVFAGIFVVALLGVLALQFVGKENKVKVGKDEVSIAEAYPQIAREAKKTDQLVKAPDPANLPNAGSDDAVKQFAQFDARYMGPVSPSKSLSVPLDRSQGGLAFSTSKDERNTAPLAVLEVPAPSTPVGAPYLGEVHPA
jgi:hypothetical protein